ncbi:MAG: hypothetical protein JRN10_05000 [Nitrososphaerota archaeon]|jgi:hypothetical protein|nr:hypothetical protein [Nitrososphaerota archaeon]
MKLKPLLLLLLMALPLVSYFTPYAGLPAYAQSSPAGVLYSIPLTINNAQNVATPSPFQQMINISDTASFWSDINLTSGYVGSNVVFFWSNGTVIPSWMENYYPSHSPPYIIWWLKIGSIPASSSITMYMGIGSLNTNYYSTYLGTVGEAPQLSPSYAEYDSGANVFNNYWNFAGTTIPSGWTNDIEGTVTWDNGLTIQTAANAQGAFYSSTTISSGTIVEGLVSVNGVASSSGGLVWVGGLNSSVFAEDIQEGDVFHIGETNDIGQVTAWGASLTTQPASGIYYIITGYFNSGASTLFVNYNNVGASASFTFASPVNIAVGVWSADVSPYNHVQWLRTRAYPPNGVMPSVSFQTSISLSPNTGINQLSSTNYFTVQYKNGTGTYTANITSNATYTFNAYQFSISQVSSASTSSERWALPSAVNVIGSAGSYAYTYYTQYSVYANYSVTGTGSGWNAPQLSYTSFGSGAALTLLTTTQTTWADAGTAWSIPTMISSATQEWLLPSTYASSGTVVQSFSLGPTYLFGNLLPVEQFNGNTEFEYILPTTSQMVSFINNTILNVNSTSSNGYNFQYFPQGTTIYIISPSGQELLSNTFAGAYQTTLSPPGNSKLYVYIPESSSPFSTQPSIVPTVIGVFSGPIGGIQVFFTLIYAVGLGAIYLRVKSAPFILIVMLITSPIIGTFFVPQMRIIFYVAAALALTGLLYEIVHKSGDM